MVCGRYVWVTCQSPPSKQAVVQRLADDRLRARVRQGREVVVQRLNLRQLLPQAAARLVAVHAHYAAHPLHNRFVYYLEDER